MTALLAAPPSLDASGRSFLLVAVGPAAEPVVEAWAAQAGDSGRPVQRWTVDGPADDAVLVEFARRLDGLRVGARLAVCGPEADVLTLGAAARRAGLVPEEITTSAVDRADIRVFCVHCEATSRLAAAPGAELTCPGCRRRLEVHEHVSGHRGSYLASAVAPPDGNS
jgi:hypothetical protein